MPKDPLIVALVAPEGEEQRLSMRMLLGGLPLEANGSGESRSSSGPPARELELDQFATLGDLRRGCVGKRYSGVAVALGTLSQLEEEEKVFLIELAQSFPLLRLHAIPGRDDVAGTVAGEALEGRPLLERFGALCRRARPRGVRLELRKVCALCASVRFGDGGGPERACIVNLSRAGFFIATPHERAGPRVEAVIEALADRQPIACEVRWHQPWGPDARSLPGFGVLIETIAEGQLAALAALIEYQPAG